jgi:DNA-binding HxlR family transcriptional regulator
MRTYGQYCSIARALDLVGDRWTLLIVRELMLQGPCRFTDLKAGLPGVATNLLSTRLKELEEAGLLRREDAPPPIATALYSLTPDGLALEPVLKSLGRWGLRQMAVERPEDAFQGRWMAMVPAWFTTDTDPDGPPATIQLIAAGEQAVLQLGDGHIHTHPGHTPNPDLTLKGPPRAILGLLTGMLNLPQATTLGLTTHGHHNLLTRLHPTPDVPPGH